MDLYSMFRDGDAREFVVYRADGTPIFRIEARYHRVANQLLANLNDPTYEPGE